MLSGRCSRCKVKLTASNAILSTTIKGSGFCRKCAKEHQVEYRSKNKEKIAEYQRKRTKAYKEKGWCKNHPEERLPCLLCREQNRKDRKKRVEQNVCIICSKVTPALKRLSCLGCLLKKRLLSLPICARNAAKRAINTFDGYCMGCGESSPGFGRAEWCLDHNHISGNFRGILCYGCNTALGQIKDNIKTLNKLIEYLTRTKL